MKGFFSELDNPPYLGSLCPDLEAYELLFDAAASEVEGVSQGRISLSNAADRILNLLKDADFVPPIFKISDPAQRHTPQFNKDLLMQLFSWIKSSSEEMKQLYFN